MVKNKHAVSLANIRWGQTYAKVEKIYAKPLKVNFLGKPWKTIRFTPSAFQDVKNFALTMLVIAVPVVAASLQHWLEG
ncbi:MAG: hypothetical protein AAB922_03025 [Patescibacteria group bacterium]